MKIRLAYYKIYDIIKLFFDSKIEQSQVHTEFAQFLIVV